MPRSRKLRRRPATPNFKFDQEYQHPHTADPTSPPETPTTSPPFSRKISLKPRHQPDFHDFFQPLASDPNIRPVGNGHQFSYQPTLRPEQLSPRSSSSSSEDEDIEEDSSVEDSSESASMAGMPNVQAPLASIEVDNHVHEDEEGDDEDEDSDEDEDDDSDAESTESESSDTSDKSKASGHEISHVTTATTIACGFTIEPVDPMDSENEGLDVLLPTEIESNRSRSRERHREEHNGMVHEFRNLNCSNETSDNGVSPEPTPEASPEGDYDYDEEAFLRRRELLKKYRRMSMGSSFGKRTHSELSDSDDDIEGLDVHEVGSSARRLRRKLHRTSLLFHDPPPARIDELDEPDSSEDEFLPRQDLARELPYWTMEIMEVDSSP